MLIFQNIERGKQTNHKRHKSIDKQRNIKPKNIKQNDRSQTVCLSYDNKFKLFQVPITKERF